ncbi:MAG: Coenzyme F420 hydrogenase/dehydrogenase, beta subunit C-terminal domain [Succinimonas sp.]|nr:Coenzyme F420 hydrogenase/dehydrogenase, beta subunit C-terminal domain [Succinimonas sp.]
MEEKRNKPTVIEGVAPGMCTGCGACINLCPRKALSFAADRFGYFVPEIDQDKCDRCGLCHRVCPAINLPPRQNSRAPALYAFAAKDTDLLRKSASGGAFGVMAEHILSQGGYVAGCAWKKDWSSSLKPAAGDRGEDEALHAEAFSGDDAPKASDASAAVSKAPIKPVAAHVIIDNKEDLSLLHKSKYLQSYMGTIFSEIAALLRKGRKVLFSGCPCQVAGLRSFLRKDYDGLICIDLLCAYTPSQAFFAKYIRETFPELPAAYEFRNKTAGKWQTYAVRVGFASGRTIAVPNSANTYQLAFNRRVMIPPHCIRCRYHNLPRYGDLTIGDFWGINKRDPNLDCKQGISAVLVNSRKGKIFLESLPADHIRLLEAKPLIWLGGNGAAFKGMQHSSSPGTAVFYSLINKTSFQEAADTALAVYGGRDVTPLQGRRCLHVTGTGISFKFQPKSWEQHFIRGTAFLFSGDAAAGAYACIDLDQETVCGREYVLCVKCRIATDSEQIDFYLTDKKNKREQLVLTRSVAAADRTNTAGICVKFSADNAYDSFMLKSSQLTGNLAYIAFEEITLIEYRDDPYETSVSPEQTSEKVSERIKVFLAKKLRWQR